MPVTAALRVTVSRHGCLFVPSRAHLLHVRVRHLSMASNAQAADFNGSQPEHTRARKRKLDSSPAVAQTETGAGASPGIGSEVPGYNGAAAGGAAAATARGQPLKLFVEQWEFRWDEQRKEYPWEWVRSSHMRIRVLFACLRWSEDTPVTLAQKWSLTARQRISLLRPD